MIGVPGAQRAGELVQERRGGDLHSGEVDEQVVRAVACARAQLLRDFAAERTRARTLPGTLNASASRFTDIVETIPIALLVLGCAGRTDDRALARHADDHGRAGQVATQDGAVLHGGPQQPAGAGENLNLYLHAGCAGALQDV